MTNTLPADYVRRQFYYVGYGNRLGDDFVRELQKSHKNAYAILLAMLPDIINTRPLTRKRAEMLEDLAADISEARGEYIVRYKHEFEEQMELMTGKEFAANRRQYKTIPLYEPLEEDSNEEALALLLIANGQYEGRTIDQWFNDFARGDTARIVNEAASGINNGLTPEEAAKAALGTKSQGYKDGIVSTSFNQARSLARTVSTGVSNAARGKWTEYANRKLKKKAGTLRGRPKLLEVYSAVLDSRTTFICSSLSGNVYKVGTGPFPPQHRGCRSSRYPIPYELAHPSTLKLNGVSWSNNARRRVGGKNWDDMTPAQRSAEILREQKRWLKKNVGELPEEQSFKTFFDAQPKSFQRDYLGPNRYARWQSGDLDIGDFIAPDGVRYTIDELVTKGIL